jgi:hypothetical protein
MAPCQIIPIAIDVDVLRVVMAGPDSIRANIAMSVAEMVDFSSWPGRAVLGGGSNGADATVAGGAISKLCVYQRFRCSSFSFRIVIFGRGSKQDRKDLNTDFHGLSTRIFTERFSPVTDRSFESHYTFP